MLNGGSCNRFCCSGALALWSGRVYEVDDGSGRMWVFSERYGVPSNGTRVAVTGRIEQGFSFGGRSFSTVLRETERRH